MLPPSVLLMVMMRTAVRDYDGKDNDGEGGSGVLHTRSMEHLSKSPTPISKFSSNLGKIGLKNMF